MEREKFEDALSTILLKHDETAVPAFNKERVWKNTRKGNNHKIWYAVASVAAVTVLAFSLLMDNQPIKSLITDQKKTPQLEIIPTDEKPVAVKVKTETTAVIPHHKTEIISHGMSITIVNDTAKQTEEIKKVEPQPVVTVQLQDPLQDQTSAVTSEPAVNVVFKRGKAPEPVADVKTTELKESPLKFMLRLTNQDDTAYYVNTNSLKLTLKARQ